MISLSIDLLTQLKYLVLKIMKTQSTRWIKTICTSLCPSYTSCVSGWEYNQKLFVLVVPAVILSALLYGQSKRWEMWHPSPGRTGQCTFYHIQKAVCGYQVWISVWIYLSRYIIKNMFFNCKSDMNLKNSFVIILFYCQFFKYMM